MRRAAFRFSILTIPVVLLAFAPQTLLAQLKVGYVDTQKIMDEYSDAVDAMQQLDDLYEKWEREATKMQRDIERKQKRFSDNVLIWSDEAKFERQKEIQRLMTRFQEFQQEKFGQDGEGAKREDELMKPIRSNIRRVIRRLARSDNFDFIFEMSDGSDLLYASNDHPDLTDKIIRMLNDDY